MSSAAHIDRELFAGAPPIGLLRRWRLLRAEPSVAKRSVVLVLMAWAPLALLTLVEGSFVRTWDDSSFLPDIAVHARLLLALPAFVLAENVLSVRLGDTLRHIMDVGIVAQADREGFSHAVADTRLLVHAPVAEIAIVVIAIALSAAILSSVPLHAFPAWCRDASGAHLSWAGHWHAYVSAPLLFIALLGVLWRWLLWVRLLWRISQMRLALLAAHPDRAAGLRFMSYSVRAFSPYGLLIGIIFAGAVANRVLHEGQSPFDYARLVGVLLVSILALFCGPLAMFTRTLVDAWRRGVFEYDALANRIGRQFEAKWCDENRVIDGAALERPDFSATTDLYSVVANVYQMRLFLFDLQGALLLASLTFLPFVPVLLLSVPIDALLARLVAVLL